ncbi:ATP-binding cassette domain-containing protein [Botrimarina sp.]|uniref:ABC transporter ATP-binding protein n=1 Tax=Botrimarina sp. TaxID=2795802 RepID=UPI0032EEC75B
MPPLFELRDVGYRQGDADILSGVDWTLHEGEHWAVLGPNGCGKTTLMRLVCGFCWQTSGTVRRLGEELVDLTGLRRHTGWVAANLLGTVPEGDTALETVVSGRFGQFGLRRLHGVEPTRADFADARAMLESMRVDAIADKPLAVLSQGERQQVLVARARMTEPRLLVLDEPCAGMDPGARERFLAWLGQVMREPGAPAVVLITHHVEEVMPEFRQTLLLAGGRVAACGPTEVALTAQSLAATYNARVDRIERHAGRLWPIWGD